MAQKSLTIGDILKSEADAGSRIAITAPANTTIGKLVKYELRDEYLVALSNVESSKVLIQPHNCTINLDNIALADITSIVVDAATNKKLTVDDLKKQGDSHGIHYIGTPKDE